MLRFFTAGESHGPCLTAIVEGFPAGVTIDIEQVNHDLARRQQGYGRGGRMKIEKDEAQIHSGVRWGESLGSPISLVIENKDWRNWEKRMSPFAQDRDDTLAVTRPRPGHADLTGVLKYNHRDVRNVLERASARDCYWEPVDGCRAGGCCISGYRRNPDIGRSPADSRREPRRRQPVEAPAAHTAPSQDTAECRGGNRRRPHPHCMPRSPW